MCIQPDVYVSETGRKSVVSILPPDNVKDALSAQCRVHGPPAAALSPGDGSSGVSAGARPRTDFAHDLYNSRVLTSNVVRARYTQ